MYVMVKLLEKRYCLKTSLNLCPWISLGAFSYSSFPHCVSTAFSMRVVAPVCERENIIGCLHDQANIEQTLSKHRAGTSRPIGTSTLAQM